MFSFSRTAKVSSPPLQATDGLEDYNYWRDRYVSKLAIYQQHTALQELPVPGAGEISQIQSESKANPKVFYASGMRSCLTYLEELEWCGKPLSTGMKVLEFGVGFGRILRYFKPFGVECFGCDATESALSWCVKHIGHIADFKLNSFQPPLDYASNIFDFVYANSVFTHIRDDLTSHWIRELRRVTKAGGVVITSHYDPNEHLRHLTPIEIDREYQSKGYIEWGNETVRENNISYRPDIFHRMWSESFEVVREFHYRDDQFHLICIAK